MLTYRVFVSSPGDVQEERLLAARVLDRLSQKWGRRVRIEPVYWEHEPLAADATYQVQITPPGDCDAVVVILWSRIGTRLPADLARPDGTRYESGTEYEIEQALAAHAAHGRPELLVYHKRKQAAAGLTSREELEDRWQQKQRLDGLVERLFRHEDGSAARAKHDFEESERFEELLRKHLDGLIARRVAAEAGGEPGASAQAASAWQGSPFRGLSVFQPEDATIFCGRSGRVRQILDALREQAQRGRPFVLVVGASGSGKSSLVRAGVIPQLTAPGVVRGIGLWRRAFWVPGTSGDPFEGLAAALLAEGALPELAATGTGAADLAADLRDRPGAAVSRLRLGLQEAAHAERRRRGAGAEPEARLALVLDQTEELFTSEGVSAEDRARLDAALAALVASGAVWVLATLRSDFYQRFTELPELMRAKEGAGQYDLPAPEPEEIGRMIREPAEIAGLRFEREGESGRRLEDVLRDEAVADPAALPLLEFTLDELYRRSEDGVLTFAAYRGLGGIEGALAHRADEVYGALSPDAQAALDPALLSLVRLSPEPDAPPSRRRAPRASLAAVPGGATLVDAFVAARLLTADRGPDGAPVVSVTHEALLRAWPRAVEWRERHAGLLGTRARVEAQAATWSAEGEAPGFLLPEGQLLDEARALLGYPGAPLGPREERLVRASLEAAAARRRRRTLRLRWAAAAAVLAALSAVLVWDLLYRPHVGWFGSVVFRHGVPEGVGEVSDDQRERRWWSYEVWRRGRLGRVERLAAVDSAGRPSYYHDFEGFLGGQTAWDVIDLRDPRQSIGRECQWDLDYEGGEVSRVTALDRTGRVVYVLDYKGRSGPGNRELTAEYTLNGVAAPRAQSGAAVVKTLWGEAGRLERVWYLDANGRRRPDRHLSWGLEVQEATPEGLPTRLASLGPGDRPTANRHGWALAEIRYDDGLLARADYFDADGRPVLTRQGYARLRIERDPSGNPVVERYDDEQGRPMRGMAEVRHTYDDAGRLVESVFLDAAQRAAVDESGSYGYRMEYTEEGDPHRFFILGPDGGPIAKPPSLVSGLLFEWAEPRPGESGPRGLAALTFLDAAGAPAEAFIEVAEYVTEAYKYDEEGNLIEIRYLDAEGLTVRPMSRFLEPAGYGRVLMTYDEHGNVVEQVYADERGLPASDLSGCASWRFSYDAHGNPVERRCFGREGQPDFGLLGAVWRTRYGETGQPVEDRFFDLDDKPANTGLGCWISELRDGSPGAQDLDRLLSVVFTRLVREQEGKPVPAAHACSQVTVQYDGRGHVMRREYFTAPDRPVAYELGCERVRVRHDFRGREIERTCLRADDRPGTASRGWARVEISYDETGAAHESYLDLEGRPVSLAADGSEELVLAALSREDLPRPAPRTRQASYPEPRRREPPASRESAPALRPEPAPAPRPLPAPPPAPAPPAAGLADAVAALATHAEELPDDYEDFLDDSDRDPEGEEEELEELFDDLEDAADDLAGAYRRWVNGGGGLRRAFGAQRTEAELRRVFEERAAEVRRLVERIDALAGHYPLGAAAEARWREVRRHAAALR